jgi:hypothetical protein
LLPGVVLWRLLEKELQAGSTNIKIKKQGSNVASDLISEDTACAGAAAD